MIKVDVIITCYNKQDTVARAIESVKKQSLTDFMCIVVDDGSTDDSWQVIEKAIENDTRFVGLQLKNSGVANARNAGVGYGNSPFVTCLDGDDGIQPDFLQTCYDAISQDKSLGIVYTDVLLSHPDGYFTVARWPDCDHNLQFEGKNQIPCCNMFRRSVFEKLGGYRQRYAPKGAGAEDAELWLRFFKLGYKAKKVTNEPLFIYNAYGGITQTGNYDEVNWINWHNTTPLPSLQNKERVANEYDNPEISVIIPVGPGHEVYLHDALDSLEAQTFTNWEAIVVLDSCHFPYTEQDEENELFMGEHFEKNYRNVYPYVRWLGTGMACENPKGAGYARNLGVQYSKGKYISFLDVDDYYQPRFLELTLSALKHFDADWLYTDIYGQTIKSRNDYEKHVQTDIKNRFHKIIKEKNNIVEYVWLENLYEWNVEKLWRSGIAAITGLYKRTDFDLVGGFDEENNREDWDFHLRLAKAGKCGLRLPLPLFTYRLHTGIRREYKDIAQSEQESKALKQQDIDRLHNAYNQKELQMACTSCKKKKINIKPVGESDLTTLEYIGKIAGGTVNGPITRKAYSLNRRGDKFYIERVHPQDAQALITRGIFKPVEIEKKTNVMVSPTPRKVEVVQLSRGERLQKSVNVAKQAADEARRQTEAELAGWEIKPDNNKNDTVEIHFERGDPGWYNDPQNYTITQLKNMIARLEPDKSTLQTLYKNESDCEKPRKTLLKFIGNLLQ